MESEHAAFMDMALEESRCAESLGNKPVAAIIVLENQVVGRGHNTVDSEKDATNHAEIVAIRDACAKLRTATLPGATLYCAMEPCPMCLWAIHMSGITRLVLGGRHAAMKRQDMGDYSVEKLLQLTRQNMEVITGVRTEECEAMRWAWRKKTGRV